jgi:hypothetical protein
MPRVNPELAKITQPRTSAVYPRITDAAAAHRHDPPIRIARDQRLVKVSFDRIGGEGGGLPLERELDIAGHRILAEQPPDFRVVRRRRQLEPQARPAHV